MSGLYKRGKIWWLRTDPVTGSRLSTRCTGKKGAEAFLAERERLAADPHYASSHTATIGKWSDELLRVKKATRSAGTLDMYRTKVGHVLRCFKRECKMIDVTPTAVDRYVAKRREETASSNTISKELIALTQLCKLAKRGGEFVGDIDSLRPVGFDREYEPRKQTLTAAQVQALFAELPPARRALLALAVATGARRSEVQRIGPGDIDLSTWTVRIAGTKTAGSYRTIPVALPEQQALLRAAAESGLLPARWVNMSKDIPKLCLKLGIPRATPNDLRRSFATWGIEAGIARADVAKLLGHTSTAMVFKVYGQESAEALGQKIRRDLGGTPASHYEVCSGRPSTESACLPGWMTGLEPATTGATVRNGTPRGSAESEEPRAESCCRVLPRVAASTVAGTRASQSGEFDDFDAVPADLRAAFSTPDAIAYFDGLRGGHDTYPRGVHVRSLTPLHLALAMASAQRRADLRAMARAGASS
jgi:integrase